MATKRKEIKDTGAGLGQVSGLWKKERHRALKILGRMALLAFVVGVALYLSACTTLPYAPPYPDHVLDDADPWIKSITYLPDAELQAACAYPERVHGCYKFDSGEMFVTDDPGLRDCAERHERSHVYEVYVRGFSFADTATHKHWAQIHCYKPFGYRAVSVMATLP